MNRNTKKIVGIGLFTAIVFIMQYLSLLTRWSVFSLTLVLAPIVIGSALYGWKAGGWLGFVFGLAVLISGDAGPFLAVNVGATLAIVLIKGTASGLLAGLCYKAFEKKNMTFAVFVAAAVCPIVNTGIFLVGCQLFFMDTIASLGFENILTFMFLGIGLNFIIELLINMILGPVIVRLIKQGRK